MRQIIATGVDWPNFLGIVRRHRIPGLAFHALAQAEPGTVPAEVIDRLRRGAMTVARRNLALLAEAIRIEGLLAKAGVTAAFLKGLPLGQLIHGDVSLRHCRDLDLLVSRESLSAARAAILAAGYDQDSPPPSASDAQMDLWYRAGKDIGFRHRDSGLYLELHWRLVDNAAILPPPAPGQWVRVPMTGSVALAGLAPSDLLLYLIAHGARHAWFRLKWLADVATLLAPLGAPEVDALLDRARDNGIRRPALQAILLCGLLYGLPVPGAAARALARDPILRGLVRFALWMITLGRGETDPGHIRFGSTVTALYHYFLGEGWRYRWAETRRDLVHPEDWARLPLAGLPHGLFFLLRVPLWILLKLRTHPRK